MTVLITRSEPGASELAQALAARGIGSSVSPLLQIQALQPWQFSQFDGGRWNAMPAPSDQPGAMIVLSMHAAQIFCASNWLKQWQDRLVDTHTVAIGEATATILRQAGFDPLIPGQASSEGILQMPLFVQSQSWHNQPIWLVSGVGGRDLIAQDFTVRLGARLCKIAVYERVNVPRVAFDVGTIRQVVVASEQTLRHFARLWLAQGGDSAVPLLLPSQRLCQVARSLGMSCPINTSGADPESVVNAICRMEQTK